MYHTFFLRHNDEIKDNIFDKQFPYHHIIHGEIQKYMLILLLNDFCSNIFFRVFVNQTGTEMLFLKPLTRDSMIL